MPSRAIFPPLAALLLTLAIPGFVLADVGAGIGADPVMLPQPALPGHAYSMSPVYVVNTGTEPSAYQLAVQRVRSSDDANVPSDWIQFAKNGFMLAPKESASVPVTLSVPSDAKPGQYFSNVVVGTVAPGAPPGGTALGARAATDIRFQVTKPSPLIPWPWPWWSYAALGAAGLLGGGTFVFRRLGISIQIDRST